MIYIFGIFITLFLAIILFTKKGKSDADIILASWLFFIGIHLFLYYLYFTRQTLNYPFLFGIELPLPLIHGPFLYLYTESLTRKVPFKIKKLLHFLPIPIIYITIINFLRLSGEQKVAIYLGDGAGYETIIIIVFYSIILSGISYVTLSMILLRKHAHFIKEQYSYTEKINLNWLRYLIYGIGVIWLIVFLGVDKYIYMATVVYTLFIGYFGIKQVGLFTQQNFQPEPFAEHNLVSDIVIHTENDITTDIEPTIKYQKSGLDNEQAEILHKKLTQLIDTQKLFTNPELTLPQLADSLQTNPNYVSQVINVYEQKSFYDYVNFLRITEFKKLAQNPAKAHYTLLALALESGFNSKTSFNRNFKKTMGISPTEYLQQIKTGVTD